MAMGSVMTEKDLNSLMPLHNSNDSDTSLEVKQGSAIILNAALSTPIKAALDGFLESDCEKNDYDWLFTPPDAPLFPSLEMELSKTTSREMPISVASTTKVKSKFVSSQMEPKARGSLPSKQSTSTANLNSFNLGVHRSSSSGGHGSTVPVSVKQSGRSMLSATSKPSRPSTPTSRTNTHSSKPATSAARSSTPVARSSKSTGNVPKSSSRSATPTSRSSSSCNLPESAPPGPSSSIIKPTRAMSRNPVQSQRSFPSVESRPLQLSEISGVNVEAPSKFRMLKSERPLSASKDRQGASSTKSSYIQASSTGRARRQSCSPLSRRVLNSSSHINASSFPLSRSHSNGRNSLNPVLIGTKMVERVVNMRRLAPPSHNDQQPTRNSLEGKPSFQGDYTGFGRTLSKKSLDMALRHMDIRPRNPGRSRPSVTSISASSTCSAGSETTEISALGVSEF